MNHFARMIIMAIRVIIKSIVCQWLRLTRIIIMFKNR